MNKIKEITKDKIKGKNKEMILVIKKLAWDTFKNTGNIDTFMELKQITDLENIIKAENNEIIKSEEDSNSRKSSI